MEAKTKDTITVLAVGVIAYLGVKYFLKNRDEKEVGTNKAKVLTEKEEAISSLFSGADGGCGCGA